MIIWVILNLYSKGGHALLFYLALNTEYKKIFPFFSEFIRNWRRKDA